jgi:nitroreductase
VIGHRLEQMKSGDPFESLEPMLDTHSLCRAPISSSLLVQSSGTSRKRYGPRGYRYVLLEGGHAGQNLCMAAASRGHPPLYMGGFIDSLVNTHLGLEEPKEGIVYMIAVGASG